MGVQQNMLRSHLAAMTCMGNSVALSGCDTSGSLCWEAPLELGTQDLSSDCSKYSL